MIVFTRGPKHDRDPEAEVSIVLDVTKTVKVKIQNDCLPTRSQATLDDRDPEAEVSIVLEEVL